MPRGSTEALLGVSSVQLHGFQGCLLALLPSTWLLCLVGGSSAEVESCGPRGLRGEEVLPGLPHHRPLLAGPRGTGQGSLRPCGCPVPAASRAGVALGQAIGCRGLAGTTGRAASDPPAIMPSCEPATRSCWAYSPGGSLSAQAELIGQADPAPAHRWSSCGTVGSVPCMP